MVGLCSLDPGPDGKWTVTQIPCHAGKTSHKPSVYFYGNCKTVYTFYLI